MHKYKEFALIKSADDAGTISGYFSTYDRIPDSYGDVIARGAFTETIQKRKESGHPFPLCWNHDLNQIIGFVDPADIEDTEKGPFMKKAGFFNTPLAQEKREIVKSGVVYQFSFAYDVREAAQVTLEDGTKANELQKLDLFEVSIVPVPANPRAEVTDIKAGRRNSAKDADAIRQAISLLQSVLDDEDSDDGEDEVKANAAAEEPEQSNPKKDSLLEYIKSMEV
jgi:HK97 family phage prohead protease